MVSSDLKVDGEISDDGDDSGDDSFDDNIDGSCIKLSREEKHIVWLAWRKTLIVKVLGRPISYTYLCNRLKQLWSLTRSFQAVDLGNGYFCIKFSHHPDYEHVLCDGP